MRASLLRLASVVTICISAILSFAEGTSAQDLMKSPPVSIEIKWDGAPCNPDGAIVAQVKNISDRKMLLPLGAGLGPGGLLIVRARSGELTSSSMHDYHAPPYDWDHMDVNSSDVLKLQTGEEASYRIRIEDYYDINGPENQISTLYKELIKNGGSLSVLYGLSDTGPTGWRRGGFFFTDPEFYKLIPSNHLVCPKVQ